MIIARSPLRITLGGGGTDLPSYYTQHGGFLIAAAIDKHVYVTAHNSFRDDLLIRYSKIENVKAVREIEHPIVREALRLLEISEPGIEITSIADVSAGTGLGSSGSFTAALLKALYKFQGSFITTEQLAELACRIEIDILGEPIGKQDQYIAAFGGVTCFEFLPDHEVKAYPLRVRPQQLDELNDKLVLFSTGNTRSASKILQEQKEKTLQNDTAMIDNLHFIKDLGYRSKQALESGDFVKFGKLLHEHWLFKKQRSPAMSNSDIDRWYEYALDHGAIGGKIIGAGGGGFFMFYSEEPSTLKSALRREGLSELKFRFEFEGTHLLT